MTIADDGRSNAMPKNTKALGCPNTTSWANPPANRSYLLGVVPNPPDNRPTIDLTL